MQLLWTTTAATSTAGVVSPYPKSANIIGQWLFTNSNNTDTSASAMSGADTNVSYVAGKVGNCMSVSGTGYIDVTDSAAVSSNLSSFAMQCWFKTSSTAGAHIASQFIGGSNWQFILGEVQGGTGKIFSSLTLGGTFRQINNATNMSDGGWHHLVITYDGSNFDQYIDNVKAGTGAFTGNLQTYTSDIITLGNNESSHAAGYNGELDQIMMWNTSLTVSDISTLWNGGTGI